MASRVVECLCMCWMLMELCITITIAYSWHLKTRRWSAIFRVWPWTLTYQKFLLCISGQGQNLYSHQKLNMYIWERLQTLTTMTPTAGCHSTTTRATYRQQILSGHPLVFHCNYVLFFAISRILSIISHNLKTSHNRKHAQLRDCLPIWRLLNISHGQPVYKIWSH